MRLKLWLDFFFRLPGTFLHELAHYLAAKLTGSQVINFSLYPKITNDTIEYGSVTALYRYKAFMIPVSIAPLIWWAILGWGLYTLGVITPIGGYEVAFDYTPLLDRQNWIWIYPGLQLLWAGKLSRQDIFVMFQGIYSASGLLAICIVVFTLFFIL